VIYAQLILEYLKVIFSAPVIAAVVAFTVLAIFREDIKALLLRFAKIRLPGGTEVSISQAAKLEEDPEKPLPKPPPSDPAALALPSDLDRKQIEEVRQLLDAERARAYLWEYRYLNYFLAFHTQQVLDWFASLPNRTSMALFDSVWLPLIPSTDERRAIITALQAHYLILVQNELVEVTPKGREYIAWRGPLPQLKT
jgi:hypothetical protein